MSGSIAPWPKIAADCVGDREIALQHRFDRKPPAAPEERVVDQNREAFAGQRVGEGSAAVIGVAEGLNRFHHPVRAVGDFLLAEELVMAVIAEGDDAGQRAASA